MQTFIGRVQYYLRLELPQAAGNASAGGTRTCRLAVCQFYEPQPTQQDLYVIKLDAPCPVGLEVVDIDSIDCVLCHGRPQSTVLGKCKRQAQSADAADVGSVFLWQYYNLSRLA